MATTLEYNGLTLVDVLTKRFDQEAVYDESNTDLLFYRFSVSVVAYCHPNQNATTVNVSPNPGGTSVDVQSAVRLALMERSRAFDFKVDGQSLLQGGAAYDYENGPIPTHCRVTHITAATMMRVEFDITVSNLECAQPSGAGDVINNRWSMSDDIDANWYITRAINGRLRVKSHQFDPQNFRALVIPPLGNGFHREAIHCATSVDGLTLEYSVVDRQVHASPPFPATTWSGTHAVSTNVGGAMAFSEFHLRLTGPPRIDKRDLVATAALVATQKLELLSGKYVLQHGAIIDYLEENTVELQIRLTHTFDTGEIIDFFGLSFSQIGKPVVLPGYDHTVSPAPGIFGDDDLAGWLVCYLQSPCNATHAIQTGARPPYTNYNPGQSGSTRVTITTGTIPQDGVAPGNINTAQYQAMFTYAQIDSDFEEHTGLVGLPLASTAVTSPSQPTPDTIGFVKFHKPVVRRTVRMALERSGAFPTVPAPQDFVDSNGIKHRYLGRRFKQQAPDYGADIRTLEYSVDAEYYYALSRPIEPNESYHLAQLPWTNLTSSLTKMPRAGTEDPNILG